VLELRGTRFAAKAEDNEVHVGGERALVLDATSDRLRVLTGPRTRTGPVSVKVGSASGTWVSDFRVISPRDPNEGPPIVFQGAGAGVMSGAPTSGTLRVLVSLVRPTDRTPTNPTTARQTVIERWADVATFYKQASYGDLNVQVDVTSTFAEISGAEADYLDPAVENIDPNVLDRFVAEAAQAAVDDGMNLDDYHMMAATIFLDGLFIRAWGNWSNDNFSYRSDDGSVDIHLTTASPLSLIAIQETANWGRCAHELGHSLVDAPAFTGDDTSALEEDVYSSTLIDPGTATADRFEMMGAHDTHPLFSGYNMEQLGWYDAGNIAHIQWDRNPKSQTFDIVAHGISQNSNAARFHLVRIDVSSGLQYYLQVRQSPGSTAQIFDDSIPTGGAADDGGLIVTTVLSETVNNNHQMRFITLLHDQKVMAEDELASDPARALTITVEDVLQARPMVCRVRVEWAQSLSPDPSGKFDLSIEPWDSRWQTPDVWVDRLPFGTFDKPLDSEGRPLGNGDKPRPGEINKVRARVSNDGTDPASDVKVTFYTVEPPGVGDNGNWAPIHTATIASIAAHGSEEAAANWVPLVGRHTCLKVFLGQQLGEVAYGNNAAQENVFDFEAPASSVPAPVVTPLAVRNPRDEEALLLLTVQGVPDGWTVGLSHAWLRLGPLAERIVELRVVPLFDYQAYLRDEVPREANIQVVGYWPKTYREAGIASRMLPIGGVTATVRPKQRVEIELTADPRGLDTITATGALVPGLAGQVVRVECHRPDGDIDYAVTTTSTEGRFRAELHTGRQRGPHRLIARTINALDAAETESKALIVDTGGGTAPTPDLRWLTGGRFGRLVRRLTNPS
jgi:hypothetical protein